MRDGLTRCTTIVPDSADLSSTSETYFVQTAFARMPFHCAAAAFIFESTASSSGAACSNNAAGSRTSPSNLTRGETDVAGNAFRMRGAAGRRLRLGVNQIGAHGALGIGRRLLVDDPQILAAALLQQLAQAAVGILGGGSFDNFGSTQNTSVPLPSFSDSISCTVGGRGRSRKTLRGVKNINARISATIKSYCHEPRR